MKINLLYILLLLAFSCQQNNKQEVANALKINESFDWILVIHPEGCKTCLDSFYRELERMPPTKRGAIVIMAKNSKELRSVSLIGNPPVQLYLDEHNVLIKQGLVNSDDQILLFQEDYTQRFEIIDYLPVLDLLQ